MRGLLALNSLGLGRSRVCSHAFNEVRLAATCVPSSWCDHSTKMFVLFSFFSTAGPWLVDEVKVEKPVQKVVDPCPSGWTHLDMGNNDPSNCYIVPEKPLGWEAARNHCMVRKF